MARGIGPLILLFSAVSVFSTAQEPPSSPPPKAATGSPCPLSPRSEGGKPGGPSRRDRAFPGGGVDADKAREAFRNMTPEERERWMRRFRDWANMPPEKKKSLADREEFFRRKMREEVEAAQNELGLELTDEQKKLFGQRYVEERRKIEEELRREMEESRRPKVKAMVERLRQEFAAPAKQQ